MGKRYIESPSPTPMSLKVQNSYGEVRFYVQRLSPFSGFVLFRQDSGDTPSRCNRNVYKEQNRAFNALWLEVGKFLENCYKGDKEPDHQITFEFFNA